MHSSMNSGPNKPRSCFLTFRAKVRIAARLISIRVHASNHFDVIEVHTRQASHQAWLP